MTKDEARLIMTRARIATLEMRLVGLRDDERSLLERIGHDPALVVTTRVDEATLQKILSSGDFAEQFAHRIKEATEVFSEIAKEDLARASAWKPLERCLTLPGQ